jgi:hypothetical protein
LYQVVVTATAAGTVDVLAAACLPLPGIAPPPPPYDCGALFVGLSVLLTRSAVDQQPPPPPPPPPSGTLEWRFDTDLEGWSCNSSSTCKWQLLTSNQHPVTSGWVALQAIGSAVSRTITIPSTARVLHFDAATHNVPGDMSRVQVRIAGVTVLDSVFTNPGSSTAFNFLTMTVDISARAGQTVNIEFIQQDDGNGSGTTLKIDNIRIEAN